MDNSLAAQAYSLFSPAKLQYDLTDDLSFEALQKAFADNSDLDFRTWYETEEERGRGDEKRRGERSWLVVPIQKEAQRRRVARGEKNNLSCRLSQFLPVSSKQRATLEQIEYHVFIVFSSPPTLCPSAPLPLSPSPLPTISNWYLFFEK